jgi:hypothetical protein
MKKNVIVCGIIAGLICAGWLVGVISVSDGVNLENGMFYGFASMILAFSLIFVGVKNYRDNYNNGVVSFGKAFTIGLYITLIASTMYVITWLIAYFYFIPDFDEKYTEHVIQSMQKKGESQAAIDAKAIEMGEMWKNYQNPVICALFTYMEKYRSLRLLY